MSTRPKSPPRRHFATGVRLIEQTISTGGMPVMGLYLYMAFIVLARSMAGGSRFAGIKPASIGIPSLLKAHPGLSQTELADLMGIERMTAGLHVARSIRGGLVRRERSGQDQRKYSLYVTRKGEAYLRKVALLIPQHEKVLFGQFSRSEQATFYRLLRKFIDTDPSQRGG